MKPKQKAFLDAAAAAGFLPGAVLGYADIDSVCKSMGFAEGKGRPWWIINDPDPAIRVGRGQFRLPSETAVMAASGAGFKPLPVASKEADSTIEAISVVPASHFDEAPSDVSAIGTKINVPAAKPITMSKTSAMIGDAVPAVYGNYVPFGSFQDVADIIGARMFYPTFVTGLSGNGKTMMLEQACAKAGRECFLVSITIETDEDDLLGGFRLIDGNTVWFDGPVTLAMRRGGILILDEMDLGGSKLMCLQRVLEGKSVLLKKIDEVLSPAPGFQVFATANTKGKGSEDGRFVGTNIMNEAMLERFPITIEQQYPEARIEKSILSKELTSAGKPDKEFADLLVKWAGIIRKMFFEGEYDEIITTRRLVHIAKAYAIFGDRMKAITLCLNRFDGEIKGAWSSLYTKLDAEATMPVAPAVEDDAFTPLTGPDDADPSPSGDLTPF